MAKTESTAVNELIELVQSNQPAPAEPAADLFAAPPAARSTRVTPPRVTSPIPPMHVAGEVAPLPPRRTPHATSRQQVMPNVPPQVRMSTADPERGNTIPPLPQPTSRPSPRASSPSVPPRPTPRSTAAQRTSAQMRARTASAPPIPRAASATPPRPRAASVPPPPPQQRVSQQVPVVPPQRTATTMPVVSPRRTSQQMPVASPPRTAQPMPLASWPDESSDITPLPVPRADDSPLPVRATASSQVSPLPVPPRSSSHASPLPVQPRSSSHASPLPIQQRPTVPSAPSLPPPTAPVAAPFDAPPRRARRTTSNPLVALPVAQAYPVVSRPRTIDATGDVVRADQWFESTAAVKKVDRTEGTAIVNRQYGDTLALIKKLIAPTFILAIVGVMVGGYFAFDGQGGKKKKHTAASLAPAGEHRVAMPVAPTPAADVNPGVAQPEPPTKAEEVAKAAEAAQIAEAAQAESGSVLPAATAAALGGTPGATPGAAADHGAAGPSAADSAAAADSAVAAAPAPTAESRATDAAPAKAVTTSPSPAPIREVQTTRGVVKLVDVRIDSKPSGATVMLVDSGKTSFLGSTPLATSLDPSRTYDVIFTLPGRPTQMAPLDPSKTSKLEVTLGRGKSERSSKRSARASIANPFGDAIEKRPEKAEKVDKSEKAEKPENAEKSAETKADKKAPSGGEGTLMVNSKPPCEILIDGKPTGLTTPQRSIPLPAGTHKVTFVNAAAGINKTVTVTITADQPTKLIQDLMKK